MLRGKRMRGNDESEWMEQKTSEGKVEAERNAGNEAAADETSQVSLKCTHDACSLSLPCLQVDVTFHSACPKEPGSGGC